MTDNRKKQGKQDDIQINASQKWEVAYWCRKFVVSKAELLAAVQAAGPIAVNVLRYLTTGEKPARVRSSSESTRK